MSIWYYYNENGDKIQVTGGQLKGLAKAGRITPGTMVETEDGKTAPARKVKGLTFVEAAPLEKSLPAESSPFTASSPQSIPPAPVQSEPVNSDTEGTTLEVPKNRMVAAFLALLLGVFGVHWFYLGEKRKAWQYLGLFAGGFILIVVVIGLVLWIVVGILALIDAIKLFTMTDDVFVAQYPPEIIIAPVRKVKNLPLVEAAQSEAPPSVNTGRILHEGRAKAKGNSGWEKYLDAMQTRPFTKVEQAEIDCFCKAYGNDVHAVDENGEPFLLHEAAAYWDIAVVRYLISLGADINAINEGFTPLMSAIAENAGNDVWFYLYHKSVGKKYHSEGDPHGDLIAFAKEMGNKEVAEYITNWAKILRSFISCKDGLVKILESEIALTPADIDEGTRRKLIEGTLKSIEDMHKDFIELTPDEIDKVRRAREEL